MPAGDHQSWISYIGAVLSPFIAAMALWVASRQSKTNVAKLRLDLYDKRFAIYENALTFFSGAGGTPQSLQSDGFALLQRQFVKAHRESQFLFDADAGIFELLGRLNLDAHKVIVSKTRGLEMGGERGVKLIAEGNDVYKGIEKSINDLEAAIGPYIRFNRGLI